MVILSAEYGKWTLDDVTFHVPVDDEKRKQFCSQLFWDISDRITVGRMKFGEACKEITRRVNGQCDIQDQFQKLITSRFRGTFSILSPSAYQEKLSQTEQKNSRRVSFGTITPSFCGCNCCRLHQIQISQLQSRIKELTEKDEK